jgi:hypothetical protein
MITLLMFSGGLDSTYVLFKLLRDTDDVVVVHHIHLLTNLGRHVPEASSCLKIVDYCRKNIRPFSYSESAIDHRGHRCHGYDLIAAGFEAGMVASSFYAATHKYVDRWTLGVAKDDPMPAARIKHAQNCCSFNCQHRPAPRLFLFPAVGPREEIEYLPRDLFDLTWSCRQPTGIPHDIRPCGKCVPCRRLALADPRHDIAATSSPNRNLGPVAEDGHRSVEFNS